MQGHWLQASVYSRGRSIHRHHKDLRSLFSQQLRQLVDLGVVRQVIHSGDQQTALRRQRLHHRPPVGDVLKQSGEHLLWIVQVEQ